MRSYLACRCISVRPHEDSGVSRALKRLKRKVKYKVWKLELSIEYGAAEKTPGKYSYRISEISFLLGREMTDFTGQKAI